MTSFQSLTLDPTQEPAYLANGLIGIRVPQFPHTARVAYVQGFVGRSTAMGVEAMAAIPYPLGFDLAVNEVWLADRPDLASFESQSLDLATGELTSRFRFTVDAASVTVELITLANRNQPTLLQQRLTVQAESTCGLAIRGQIDWRGAEGNLADIMRPGRQGMPRKDPEADALVLWESVGGLSQVGLAYYAQLHETPDLHTRTRNDYGHERDLALTHFGIAAQAGRVYVMDQTAAVVPDAMHEMPHLQASRMLANALWIGWEAQRAANHARWTELWRGRVILHGAEPHWQETVDAAFFYLHSSLHRSSLWGIAPFGLSRSNYLGHVFWDYETFMFPAVLLTAPEAARASLDYRTRCVPMARQQARMYGHVGLLFPWQSGRSGSEVTPFYNGSREHHINPVVALAFAQYVHATGDRCFLREQAWPVLRGVAEWFADFARKTERGWETRNVASANERFHNVRNDAQFHLHMKAVLLEAAAFAECLGEPGAATWRAIAADLYFHTDPASGAVLQFEEDEPYRPQEGNWGVGITHSVGPMYGAFPLGQTMGETRDAATAAYLLEHMWGYMGMPMSAAFCAVWAAQAGRRDDALRALEEGTARRVRGPFRMLSEFGPHPGRSPDLLTRTTFVTGQGALLTSILLGFCGLQIGAGDAASWRQRPVSLPSGWTSIEVGCVHLRGGPHRMLARHGEMAELTPLQSESHS